MNRIQLLCVGRLKEEYWRKACGEYEKRLSPFCRFSIVEIPENRLPENPSQAQIEAALKKEGEQLLQKARGTVLAALCIEGTQVSSPQFASMIEKLALQGQGEISLVIGSSFGLSPQVKQAAQISLSMSEMTFPHQLARVMLCEQLYRAFQILHNGKYHK